MEEEKNVFNIKGGHEICMWYNQRGTPNAQRFGGREGNICARSLDTFISGTGRIESVSQSHATRKFHVAVVRFNVLLLPL